MTAEPTYGSGPSNADLMLPSGYARRLERVEDRAGPADVSGDWQRVVHQFARVIADRSGARRVVGVGCGSGAALASLGDQFSVVGIDSGSRLERCRYRYPQHEWIDADLESDSGSVVAEAVESLIICSDVIERLVDPRSLLSQLRDALPTSYGVVLCALDRRRARGASLEAPVDAAHTMEWTLEELNALLRRHGLKPLVHGFTRDDSAHVSRNNQLAFIPGGRFSRSDVPTARSVGAWLRSRRRRGRGIQVLGVMACYNEVDMIASTVDRLLGQGLAVHLIDNWSTDGTWELLESGYGGDPRVTLERFPDAPVDQFRWAQILTRMDEVAARSSADWIVHVDADEQLESFRADLGLVDALDLVDRAGYDVVDFTALDFRPTLGP